MKRPFSTTIITEPRQLPVSVTSLNQHAMDHLLNTFDPLLQPSSADFHRVELAQFIISPQPGYGKSHLIGRLFETLRGHASLVYLRPFENSESCWSSLLIKVMQQMEYPDGGKHGHQQLEEFAHALWHYVFVHIKSPPSQRISELSLTDFTKNKGYSQWMQTNYRTIARSFKRYIQQQHPQFRLCSGVSLQSWLAVLLRYTYFPNDCESRESCLDWLKGGSVDPAWAKHIGMRLPDNPKYDLESSASNELCKLRLLDFCQLARFFRPFLFCFDQTENYAKNVALSRCFGIVIENMVATANNQMTILTANQHSWVNSIQPHWEEAHQQRINAPLELEGINKLQAKNLLEQRLGGLNEKSDVYVQRFLQSPCLDDLFAHDSEISVRHLLRQCDQYWMKIIRTCPTQAVSTLSESHLTRVQQLLNSDQRLAKKELRYNPDAFWWLYTEVVPTKKKVAVCTKRVNCFSCSWQSSDAIVFFGFEATSGHFTWRRIARAAEVMCQENSTKKSTCILLRTPDLPTIPKTTWKKIGPEIEATVQRGGLHIATLSLAQTASIYAAYALYLDAREGNLEGAETPDAVLLFSRKLLTPLWLEINRPNCVAAKIRRQSHLLFQRQKTSLKKNC